MSGLLRVGTKFGILGGTVYFSSKMGVWGDSDHSVKVYKDLYSLIAPYMRDVPVEIPELPRITDMTSTAKTFWNSGVMKTGRFLLDLPGWTSNFVKENYKALSNQLNSSSDSTST
ncbi:MICOS complex subunit MIC13 homolog QIL1 [Halyomorpha halys]|uniref:MICOS complex subunit MIC13 homolog QIL1 n=1 Tax=Halyomorpha halys TaxID=286706 RepID=UPI0006D4EE13|nr:MICOS complex subunit MIC13 homolog QIL1 [Halyomorpha halys]